jgi:hypothetical protein
MSSRLTRAIAAGCGVLGVVMLTAHFLIPAGVPNDSAGVARIASFAHQHHDSLVIAPAIMTPLGIAILQTPLRRRADGYTALAFGALSQILGLIGLFIQIAFVDVNPAVLGLENLWLIAVALALLRTAPTGSHNLRARPPLNGVAP